GHFADKSGPVLRQTNREVAPLECGQCVEQLLQLDLILAIKTSTVCRTNDRDRSGFLHNESIRVRKKGGPTDREFRSGENEPISRRPPWTNRQIHRIKLDTQQGRRQVVR